MSVIKDVNKESFYSMPDSARFWTYDLLEGKTYAHIKTFNYKRGLYKITARDSCSGTSYFVLFRNYEYEIFDWVDEELLKKVASLLNEANTDETVKRKVYEELERYRKRQGFMYYGRCICSSYYQGTRPSTNQRDGSFGLFSMR